MAHDKSRATPGLIGHTEANEVSRPSHHWTAVWNSGECRCRFRPTEGAAESQALAWEADRKADNSRALFATSKVFQNLNIVYNKLPLPHAIKKRKGT